MKKLVLRKYRVETFLLTLASFLVTILHVGYTGDIVAKIFGHFMAIIVLPLAMSILLSFAFIQMSEGTPNFKQKLWICLIPSTALLVLIIGFYILLEYSSPF